MKLLLDQNISHRVALALSSLSINITQVRALGLEGATDIEIWTFAKRHDYTIVTFDSDFLDLVSYRGFPPKVVRLGCGNQRSSFIAALLEDKYSEIEDFIKDAEAGYLELL